MKTLTLICIALIIIMENKRHLNFLLDLNIPVLWMIQAIIQVLVITKIQSNSQAQNSKQKNQSLALIKDFLPQTFRKLELETIIFQTASSLIKENSLKINVLLNKKTFHLHVNHNNNIAGHYDHSSEFAENTNKGKGKTFGEHLPGMFN